MFYDTSSYREKLVGTRDDRVHGIVVVVPSESKRLIAKGVLALPEVKRVLKEGLFVVSRGTTTAYIAEEILGVKLPKANCTAGIITERRLAVTIPEEGLGPWVFRRGVKIVSSGGVGGSEGAVVIALEGSDETLKRAFDLVKSVKGEPPIEMPRLQPPVQAVFN